MAINKTIFRGKEIITIDGKVDAFYVNPIKPEHIKTYTNGKQPWTPTHRYNLIVDGQPISLGMGDKDGVSDRQIIQGKDNDGKYHALVKGLEVSVEVTENGEYQGKTQYQSSNSKVVIIDASGAESTHQKGSSGSVVKAPFDQQGMATGHALNGAFNFLITQGIETSNENIIKYAKMVHNVTDKINTTHKEKYEKVSQNYKAMTGHAVLNACKFASEDSFEGVLYSIAIDFLDNVVPVVAEHVKGEAKPVPAVKTTRAAPAKKNATKATPVMEPLEEEMDDPELPF